MEPVHQITCDRPRDTVSNCATVKGNNRDDFSCRAGEEALVSGENIVAGYLRLGDAKAEFHGDFKDDLASDTRQRSGVKAVSTHRRGCCKSWQG